MKRFSSLRVAAAFALVLGIACPADSLAQQPPADEPGGQRSDEARDHALDAARHAAPEDDAPEDGAPEDGAPEDGATGDRAPGDDASDHPPPAEATAMDGDSVRASEQLSAPSASDETRAPPPIPPAERPERPPERPPLAASTEPSGATSSGLLPTAAADRPLTLPAGIGLIGVGYSVSLRGLGMTMPIDFALGVTDDLTVGVRYSVLREPELRAAGRVYHDDVVEVGFKGLLRIPAFQNGDTVLAVEANLLVRPASFMRVLLGLGLDLLFSDPVLPLVYAPAQVEVSLTKHFFLGVDGWAGWDDGYWVGGLGGYLGFTVASAARPIMDLRLGARAEIPREGVTILVMHAFYPDIF